MSHGVSVAAGGRPPLTGAVQRQGGMRGGERYRGGQVLGEDYSLDLPVLAKERCDQLVVHLQRQVGHID